MIKLHKQDNKFLYEEPLKVLNRILNDVDDFGKSELEILKRLDAESLLPTQDSTINIRENENEILISFFDDNFVRITYFRNKKDKNSTRIIKYVSTSTEQIHVCNYEIFEKTCKEILELQKRIIRENYILVE